MDQCLYTAGDTDDGTVCFIRYNTEQQYLDLSEAELKIKELRVRRVTCAVALTTKTIFMDWRRASDIQMSQIGEEPDIQMSQPGEESDIQISQIDEEPDIQMSQIGEEPDIQMSHIGEEPDI
ncbi:hypothetical protein RRG08_032351, partial [Elysia crispata]